MLNGNVLTLLGMARMLALAARSAIALRKASLSYSMSRRPERTAACSCSRIAVSLPDISFPEGFAPDGMCWMDDRLVVAGSASDLIAVVGLGGRPHGMLSTGRHTDPTNLCVSEDRLLITLGYALQLVSLPITQLLRTL